MLFFHTVKILEKNDNILDVIVFVRQIFSNVTIQSHFYLVKYDVNGAKSMAELLEVRTPACVFLLVMRPTME